MVSDATAALLAFLRQMNTGDGLMKKVAMYSCPPTTRQDRVSQKRIVARWLSGLDPQPDSVTELEDTVLSGRNTNRPGLQKLLRLANDGEIDTIVVYKLDHLSRSASNAICTLLELDEKGVGFVSVTQEALNLSYANPHRTPVLAAFAEINKIRGEAILKQTKAGLEAARQRGKKRGRPGLGTPQQLRRAKRLRLDGLSLSRIAARMGFSKTKVYTMLAAEYVEPTP